MRIFLLTTSMLIAILTGTAAAQFRFVPSGSGVARVATATISGSYALAGGGVVLRGIASCAAPASHCEVTSISIGPGLSGSKLTVGSDDCETAYSVQSWVIKDAAALVASETQQIVRNVTLLADPTESEINGQSDISDYFIVELSEPLIGRKAGEILMAVDLMLTDPDFYSGFDVDWDGREIDETTARTPRNQSKVAAFVRAFTSTEEDVANWTWNDRHTSYKYSLQCDQHKLRLTGAPSYTFLDSDGHLAKRTTELFQRDATLVHDINPDVYTTAIQFARVSALFRYLRDSKPSVWETLLAESKQLPESHGKTPRLIARE
jgi:hypothetical protein